ncbi:dienelactone hydrolase family protein [Pseudarthrobacter sp. MDT3-26]|uniref:dienelactone hydrolase family protein n=1 Tax=Pseudarthrobacter raffinosi TaxID=2953651 RepID=UPI00208E906C|nr:dienelactone hydrolase family protein [Pseudarthrobacter sp. MDT3-26]MCO4265272.1 dienelactone hydrolase family protein [Pseudarthrobacter sp. MDT3-26]
MPLAPTQMLALLTEPDDVCCLGSARNFQAVGYHYSAFSPIADEEVVQLLDAAARRLHRVLAAKGPGVEEEVEIPSGAIGLRGNLQLPARCDGIEVFAHGSGSGRHSPRNRFVASVLQRTALGTLLLNLLTPAEEVNRENVFDIPLLARRLMAATRWLGTRNDTSSGLVGYFGASTGAGAALWAAAEPGARIGAIVSRGGRPDLAGPRLAAVRAPTLLIVGSADPQVLALNRRAMALMRAPTRLEIIPEATHLFEEPGTLTQAATLAAEWFSHHLLPARNEESAPELPQ